MVRNSGCPAKVCFAIDGSASLSIEDFRLQKEFVMDIVSIIATDYTVRFAGVQYGIDNIPISPLISNDAEFLERVNATIFQSASRTFMGAGIVYCDFELDVDDALTAPTKIVVIGDGRDNFGGDPVRRARNFKEYYGDVAALSTVGVEFGDTSRLDEIAAAGGGRVFAVTNYRRLSRRVIDLVRDVCGI
ncbi:von Willebrand factor A-like protein [Gracilaria domingensis]|nr:von Willebrand factor A-like protein [Gracilaria domingensis]